MTATFSRRQEVVHGICRTWYDLRWPGGSMTVEVGPDAPDEDREALRVFRRDWPKAVHVEDYDSLRNRTPQIAQVTNAFQWKRGLTRGKRLVS